MRVSKLLDNLILKCVEAMENKDKFLITGIMLCLALVTVIAFSSSNKIGEPYSQYDHNLLNSGYLWGYNETGLNTTNSSTGCCTVIAHVNHGHDIVSYRRDSNLSADIIINKMHFNGQNAIRQYKLQNGYFCHVIITQNGWIISIGGKDSPTINKELEKLGSDIMSRGSIKNKDLKEANLIIKQNGWGHFVIKSPDDNVGIAIYDCRVHNSIIKLFKMNDGDYIRVPNTPKYYNTGNFSKYGINPIDAAIQIIGTDPYGLDRRDVITYELINDTNSMKLNIWASFDGGTLLHNAKGKPDNIMFINNNSLSTSKLNGDELPRIPNKLFLGEETLQNNDLKSNNNLKDYIFLPILSIMIIGAVFYRRKY